MLGDEYVEELADPDNPTVTITDVYNSVPSDLIIPSFKLPTSEKVREPISCYPVKKLSKGHYKGADWIRNRYFRVIGNRNWCFFAPQNTEGGEANLIEVTIFKTISISHRKAGKNLKWIILTITVQSYL